MGKLFNNTSNFSGKTPKKKSARLILDEVLDIVGKIQPQVMYYIQIYAGYQRELAIIELCKCINV